MKNNTCKHGCDLAFVVQTNNLTYFKIDILNESGFHRSATVLNVLKVIIIVTMNTVCHLNDSLISRCTLYKCVYRIIQIIQQHRTGIGIYATDQSLRIQFHYCYRIGIFASFNFCDFYRPAKFHKNLTTAENTRYTVFLRRHFYINSIVIDLHFLR